MQCSIFIQENVFEIVFKLVAIFFRPEHIKPVAIEGHTGQVPNHNL